MKWNKMGLSLLVIFIAVTFTANPLLAMEGRVDNLKFDGSCTSEQKAVVVDAFRTANLLVRFSWTAVNIRQMIAENETFDINTKPNMVVDKYTGLKFDQDRIVDTYTKVFGPYDSEFWKIIDQNYATVTPLPFPVITVCERAANPNCSRGEFAVTNNSKISVCPNFFNYSLDEAKKLALYKEVEEIELFRAGVILHEFIHLNFMNTRTVRDYGYELKAVLNLEPSKAKKNADSYHVFSLLSYGLEKTPKCVLPTDRWCNCGSGMQCR